MAKQKKLPKRLYYDPLDRMVFPTKPSAEELHHAFDNDSSPIGVYVLERAITKTSFKKGKKNV